MVNKLFALASVTALAGLVSAVAVGGCSETVVENPVTPDSGTDGGKVKGDAAPPDDDDDTDEPLCYKEDPVDVSEVPYKAGNVVPGACKSTIEKTIKDFIDNNKQGTWDDLKAEISSKESAACASCVFSKDTDAKWAPIVQVESGAASINVGGCIGVVSKSDACGEAAFKWDLCLNAVCKDCEQGSTCGQDAQGTACKAASEEFGKECGNNAQSYLNACGNLFKAIAVQCSGEPDAGDGN